jgi:hypothetical protein
MLISRSSILHGIERVAALAVALVVRVIIGNALWPAITAS